MRTFLQILNFAVMWAILILSIALRPPGIVPVAAILAAIAISALIGDEEDNPKSIRRKEETEEERRNDC